jgi:hypothetical protein
MMSLSVVGLLCACGKPLPPGTYTVKTTVLTQKSDRVDRRYEIETSGRRSLCLRSASGEDSSSLDAGKAEALLTISKRTQEAVLEMTLKTGGSTMRFKRELPLVVETDLTTVLSESRHMGVAAVTNKTTLLRLASGDRWLELSVE